MARLDLDRLSQQILEIDESVRYVAAVNKMGKIVASKLRGGLKPILTEQERESYALKAALGKMTMEDFAFKLGPLLYTAAIFKHVKRIEIPRESRDSGDESPSLFILSFDFSADHESIILKKILPLLKQSSYI